MARARNVPVRASRVSIGGRPLIEVRIDDHLAGQPDFVHRLDQPVGADDGSGGDDQGDDLDTRSLRRAARRSAR